MVSVSEAEIGATYHNVPEAFPTVTTLEKLSHPQPPTPLQVNNTTSDGYSNDTINPKQSKSMDKCYHWLQDRVRQKQFLVYFCLGITNLANPFTKHHPPKHFRIMHQNIFSPTEPLLWHVWPFLSFVRHSCGNPHVM